MVEYSPALERLFTAAELKVSGRVCRVRAWARGSGRALLTQHLTPQSKGRQCSALLTSAMIVLEEKFHLAFSLT